MSNQENNFVNFVAAVVLGAAVGSITALLFAPNKGERTRRKLFRKLRDVNENLEDILEKGKDSFIDFKEGTEDNISQALRKVKKN